LTNRGLNKSDIAYVIQNGQKTYIAGTIQFFLGKKNIPEFDRKFSKFSRLEGTRVLISSIDCRTVITVYRNKDSNKKECRKSKYNHNKIYNQLPLAS